MIHLCNKAMLTNEEDGHWLSIKSTKYVLTTCLINELYGDKLLLMQWPFDDSFDPVICFFFKTMCLNLASFSIA